MLGSLPYTTVLPQHICYTAHMPPEHGESESIKTLLRENQRLLVENNTLLKELKRANVLGAIFRIIWFFIIIGILVGAYVFVVGPFLERFDGSFEEIRSGLDRVPSFDSFRGGAASGVDSGDSN